MFNNCSSYHDEKGVLSVKIHEVDLNKYTLVEVVKVISRISTTNIASIPQHVHRRFAIMQITLLLVFFYLFRHIHSFIGKEYGDFGGSPFFSEPKKKAAFLPFGYGTRACVGEKFATLGIATLIASLLQNYEVLVYVILMLSVLNQRNFLQIRFQQGLDNDPKPILNDCILQLLPSPKVVFVKRSK
ncbi:hypothetical protein GW17_00005940 [Ensete ventricosum]|uniref:Uncharacterized protein n=1 Tax=Ensete ventricosum TaxID=4639 RepID=A0A444G3W8_ENSVE|nr:hypothetical protein GW17_00005940 [Ensete ventricosum]RZR73450.1 hypothetical protein BHM03_00024495 [Ensete ventricosum]